MSQNNTGARISRTIPDQFRIQLYTHDGRFLREYTLDPRKDKVATLRAAERVARNHLSDHHRGPVIVILSQETLTKLRQVQITVDAARPV